MDENFVLTVRSMFERIMKETRTILVNMERRYTLFRQQQLSFAQALDRMRDFWPGTPGKVKNIAQIQDYVHHVSENRTDTRICKIFLGLVRDLDDFRRTLERLSVPTNDVSLEYMFATWKKVLDPQQDISHLRERTPASQLYHLGVEENRVHFGGIISVLPIAMDCAKQAYNRLNAVKAYRQQANEYHFVEGLKIERQREREERFFANKFKRVCGKKPCNDPVPMEIDAPRANPKGTQSRASNISGPFSRKVKSSASQGAYATRPKVSTSAKSPISGLGQQSHSVITKHIPPKNTRSIASGPDLKVGTKLQAFSRPGTKNDDRRTVISSATASTRSTESDVVSHIKEKILDPRKRPTHGTDPRPRDDNVGRAFQYNERKHTSPTSMASDQKRLQDAFVKSKKKLNA